MTRCALWVECRADAAYRVIGRTSAGLDLDVCERHRDEFVAVSHGVVRSEPLPGGGRR